MRIRSFGLTFFAFSLSLTVSSVAQPGREAKAPSLTQMPAGVQMHIDRAKKIMDEVEQGKPNFIVGQFFNNIRNSGYITPSLLPTNNPVSHPPGQVPGAPRAPFPILPATKVFDQFYWIGNAQVGVWVLSTPAGMMMWDAMNNASEAENIIEPGMRAVGLDPKNLRYILVTHGHGDHFGGVPYFTKKYPQIRVVSSDWDYMSRSTNKANPPPALTGRDIVVTDGQKLTLGDTTVTLYITPGHTPKSMLSIIPVTDRGTKHVVAIPGSLALTTQVAPTANDAGLDASDKGLDRLIKLSEQHGVDVIVNNHPDFTNAPAEMAALKNRKPGEENPLVMGKSGVQHYLQGAQEISAAYRGLIVDAAKVEKK